MRQGQERDAFTELALTIRRVADDASRRRVPRFRYFQVSEVSGAGGGYSTATPGNPTIELVSDDGEVHIHTDDEDVEIMNSVANAKISVGDEILVVDYDEGYYLLDVVEFAKYREVIHSEWDDHALYADADPD